ncbi:MAG: sulfatase-like hydrolase/transferase [Desulfamplus sp.]|nr:sulfatase-like hydrolase/transferase [Desulfamplus sp.]
MFFRRNAVLASLCWMAFFFSEWLFFTTKISFMSTLSMTEKVGILFISVTPFLFAHLLLAMVVCILCLFLPTKGRRAILLVPVIPAAVIGSCLITLLIENFTYTIFGYNMAYATGWMRLIYTIPFLGLIIFFLIRMWHWINMPNTKLDHMAYQLSLVVILAIFVVSTLAFVNRNEKFDTAKYSSTGKDMPNIVFFVADAVPANHISLYGYERQTTPALAMLAEDALIAENCFSNSVKTTGSIGAFYTGRLPTQTRLIYRPDILMRHDSYKHLPGILRKLGYRNFVASVRHHADPEDLNLKDGFDFANGRYLKNERSIISFALHFFPSEGYFIKTVYDRVAGRIAHIFAVEDMVNVHDVVTTPDSTWFGEKYSDLGRLRMLAQEISRFDSPFFAHAQLQTTHGSGGIFKPHNRHWSMDKEFSKENINDFFDDTILDVDMLMDEFIKFLKKSKHFDNTIFIYASDHGPNWNPGARIPLIMRFPRGEHKGTITQNVQMIDLAPTILDYLGVKKPSWMEGISLLSSDYPPLRPVLMAYPSTGYTPTTENGMGRTLIKDYSAPFYSLGALSLVVANRSYTLNLAKNELLVRQIDKHTAPIEDTRFPAIEEVRTTLLSHLKICGYDISSLSSL